MESISLNEKKTSASYSTKNEKPSKDEDFDDVLKLVGSEGKYQKILLWVVMCPIVMIQPVFTLNALFMLNQPNHWCKVPGFADSNLTVEGWRNQTIPWEIGPDLKPRYSQCKMFDITNETTTNKSIVKCKYGWEYDKSDYEATIPTDFDWVCDHDHYATDALTLYAIGNCIGTLALGWCADKYGRKPIFFITVFINTFFRGVSLFVPQSVTAFLILQLIIGTAFPVMYITPNMIVAEIGSKEFRGLVYAVGWVIWVVGMASLPLIAYLARHWFTIGVITSTPGIFLFLYYFALPESPRWLVSVGRIDDAIKVLRKIAKVNGTEVNIANNQLEIMLKNVALKQEEQKMSVGVWTLFSKFRLGLSTAMLTISWSMNALIYYVVTINASNMSGNQFLNFFYLAIIEVPAGCLGGYLVDKTGRRWTQVVFFLFCMIAFLVASVGVSFPDLSTVSLVSVITAKFCVTLTFLIVYLQATEIFPTQVRSTGSGFASTISSAVGIVGPYIVFLAKFNVAIPYLVMALLAILGLVASAYLPETFKQNLPESLEEANNFGKGVKFWSFLPEMKKNNSNGSADTERK